MTDDIEENLISDQQYEEFVAMSAAGMERGHPTNYLSFCSNHNPKRNLGDGVDFLVVTM